VGFLGLFLFIGLLLAPSMCTQLIKKNNMTTKTNRLDSYFQTKNKKAGIFFLDWLGEVPRIQWLVDKPKHELSFEESVYWKEIDLHVGLVGCVSGMHAKQPNGPPLVGDDVIPLVKSNLQKCVRRQLVEKAMRTAHLFMSLDISLFLRRLSIIMLEDVVLHESFPILMWLVAAVSKGFMVTPKIKEWLMGVVEWMCREKREDYWTHGIDNTTELLDHNEQRRLYKRVEDHEHRDLLYSLLFRSAYGALPGDQAMITHFIALVEKGGILDISREPIGQINPAKYPPLPIGQMEPCSADFHCFPHIVDQLVREKRVYTKQQIKGAVWHHSSRYNKRVVLPEGEKNKLKALLQVWESIKGRLWHVQRDLIKVCENKYAYANRVL
jgi:hypothetical protein